MKTSLIILVGFLLSVSWISYLGFGWLGFTGNEVMVDGITVSAIIVTILSVVFSIMSWFLFSWATRSINYKGVMLSVITGVVMITPFRGDLGPMAAVLVGLVAGFAAHMIQKKITIPTRNKPLVIGAVTIAASYAILFAMIVSVQTTTSIWDDGSGVGAWTETPKGMQQHCGEKYMRVGNDGCILNPEFIEPNTIIIYGVPDSSRTRLSIAPHDLMMNLTDGNTVTFVNNGTTAVNIFVSDGATAMPLFDNSKSNLSFGDVKPSSQRAMTINGTGYYQFLVQDSRHGSTGVIVALSEDTDSLPVEIRAKMAQSIVGSDFRRGEGLISVGSGGAEPGITIGIDKKFRDRYDDAEQFYYEKYRKMIPFDVPIKIEFTEPIRALTG